MGDTHTFAPDRRQRRALRLQRASTSASSTRASTARAASTPNVSANLGARNINLGPNVERHRPLRHRGRADRHRPRHRVHRRRRPVLLPLEQLQLRRRRDGRQRQPDLQVRRRPARAPELELRRRPQRRHEGPIRSTARRGSGFVSGNYNGIGPNDTGSSLANFLLGYRPGFISRGDPGGPYFQSNKEIAFFVQDDWKATPTLTLNLGLRYDIFTAPTERFDEQSNFDPATRTIIVAGENAPGGRDLAETDKNNFGPRIGFAYSGFKEDRTLVLRGGYGIVYSTDVSGAAAAHVEPRHGRGQLQLQPDHEPRRLPGRRPRSATSSTWACRPPPSIVAAPGTTLRRADRPQHPLQRPEPPRRALPPVQPDRPVGVRAELAGRGRLRRLARAQPADGRTTSAPAGDQGGPGSREVLGH